MTNKQLYHRIDQAAAELCAISDDIFDHPELSGREYHACEVLTAFLERAGFRVEKGVGGLETAFRATWSTVPAAPTSACFASMTPCLIWATAAAITPKVRLFLAPHWL